jgi:hypothetical protein
MDSTLSTITIFPSNEAELKHYISTIKGEILSGTIDPLSALKQLKYAEKTIAALLKDAELEGHFLEEAEKYGKSFEHLGIKFTVQEVGTKYDFSGCQDSFYDDLIQTKTTVDAKIKEREAFLKTVPEDGIVNGDTGEVIFRASKSSQTKVVVRL